MKKIISCVLSGIMLMQTFAYSQTVNPTKQQVADIYNEVSSKINSAPALKKFKGDDKITPIIAMSAIANIVVKFDTPEELASLLKYFGIEKGVHAPVYELLEEAENTFKVEHEFRMIGQEYNSPIYKESIKLFENISESQPEIINYYLDYQEARDLAGLGIRTSSDVQVLRSRLETACQKMGITSEEVINAFDNIENIIRSDFKISSKQNLLVEFINKLSRHAGYYDIDLKMNELASKMDALPVEEDIDLMIKEREKIKAEYLKADHLFDAEKEQFERIKEAQRITGKTDVKEIYDSYSRLYKRGVKYFRALGRFECFEHWPIRKFAQNGALFAGVLALFSIGKNIKKANNIKTNMSNRNQAQFALQNALEENKYNLYAFLEQLPDNAQDAAFEYIAEDYFDDFQNQTKNILYALAVLETPSSKKASTDNQKEIRQQVDKQFDIFYNNADKKFKQVPLNI
ncbi:MAG: hypothetical protein J6S61_00485 [Elusimicrobiaceae bacterium]|nr:hypothetical protein [Elusimicrobiaceae bacterium]